MQVNRLFEIVYILMDRDRVTAGELSKHFEVSVRTIYRDVEALSASGIPIYMSKGKNGGISLLPGYILNKSVLSDSEKDNILVALKSMNIMDDQSVSATLTKLSGLFGKYNSGYIDIDFGDWGNFIKETYELSKEAILTHHIMEFEYIASNYGRTLRRVEPYVLWFKDKSWYLKAFCLGKHEPRLFKLSRMKNVRITDDIFIPLHEDRMNDFVIDPQDIDKSDIKLYIDKECEYRVLDEFKPDDVEKLENGDFKVTLRFPEDNWLYGYILSYGCHATVLGPNRVRQAVADMISEASKNYT